MTHAPMSMPNSKSPPNELGALLRHWRDMRGKSQLQLSLESGVSQRHISFIESARSVPSRDVLIGIAETLDIPLHERNTLLLAAGYALIYSEGAWDAVEMKSVAQWRSASTEVEHSQGMVGIATVECRGR
jgi:transcriptional regulator with XRE-family HTH domain